MTALGPVSIDMYLPGFPLIEQDLHEDGVERTMATYLVGIALGQLFYGPLSDRFGRKPPLYWGLTLYTLGALGCALSANMSMLISMRVVQALGGCAAMVIGRAVVRDRCEPHDAARAFSTLMLIVAVGPIVAPVFGGWVITAIGWRSVFYVQSAIGLVLLIAMHRVLVESRDPAHVTPMSLGSVARGYLLLLKSRAFIGYSLVSGFAMGAMFCYVTGSPTVLIPSYGLSAQQFGALIAVNGVAFMTASRWNIVSLRSSGPAEVLRRSIWIPMIIAMAFTLLAKALQLPLWAVMCLQVGFFVSVARVFPHVSAVALAPYGRQAGTASSLMGAVQSGVAVLAGIAAAAFSDGTLGTLGVLITTGAFCAWLAYSWARRQKP
jgi:DHA1 family bicyclomycin/chloramphenicol resistance-like MFS transporter